MFTKSSVFGVCIVHIKVQWRLQKLKILHTFNVCSPVVVCSLELRTTDYTCISGTKGASIKNIHIMLAKDDHPPFCPFLASPLPLQTSTVTVVMEFVLE